MSKFRDGLIGPTVILFAICFAITIALAAVFNMTDPLIKVGEIESANEARREVLREADSFTEVAAQLPEGVLDAYKADNGAGYVFTSQAKGFDGQVTYVIGINAAGEVVGINMFDHTETPGLGTKVGNAEYLAQYMGGVSPDAVDAITGATKTSNSLKNSLKQAKAAFELVQ